MKPGDRMWIVNDNLDLVQVDIVLVQQNYAAIGVVVGTGKRIPHAHRRFQPTRRRALEAALEDARRRAHKATAELVLAELESEVAA